MRKNWFERCHGVVRNWGVKLIRVLLEEMNVILICCAYVYIAEDDNRGMMICCGFLVEENDMVFYLFIGQIES